MHPTIRCEAVANIVQAGGDDKAKTFDATVYTGGQMRVAMFYRPVVIDLAGLRTDTAEVPVYLNHSPGQIVGHGEVEISAKRVRMHGALSGATPAADQVAASAKLGFPWKMSVGVSPEKIEFVEPGSTAKANGRNWQGPIHIVRGGVLGEVSFVPRAADSKTSVRVAAQGKDKTMNEFNDWLTANGFEPDKLDDRQREFLRAQFDAEKAAAGDANPEAIEASLAEVRREIAGIRLEMHRDGRASGHVATGSGAGAPPDEQVLEAAVMRHAGLRAVAEGAYDARTLEAADRLGITSMIDVCKHVLRAAGVEMRGGREGIIRAAFSQALLPGILSNVANKALLDAYRAFPSVARRIARKLSANDFKQHTGYRLTGDAKLLPVTETGEITHGRLGEDSFSFQVGTFGRLFQLTRPDIVNDDLSALEQIPRMLGRGAAMAMEEAFWTLVLANAGNFFGTANKNHRTGAGSALDASGLSEAVAMFLKQTDGEGKPISVLPRYLVCPPEKKTAADELYVSRTFNTAGGSSTDSDRVPATNPFHGLYEPMTTPYLSAENFHAKVSANAWYLFGSPADVAAFGIAYLHGVEQPTIEQVDLPADRLGVGFRGVFDFGVCQIDHRGAVKNRGT